MEQCTDIDPLLTPWVDGLLEPAADARVVAHLSACPACTTRAAVERATRRLIADRREALTDERAPAALRERLQAIRTGGAERRSWARLPVAVAATAMLALSGATLHLATGRSTTVLAAQLAIDHAKCHLTVHQDKTLDPAAARERLASRYGFHATVPPGSADHRLQLVGARRCLTGDGTNAHILYRYEGHPVSLYLLPSETRADTAVDVLGARSYLWSRHNGTYVLVADPALDGLPQLVEYMQQATR